MILAIYRKFWKKSVLGVLFTALAVGLFGLAATKAQSSGAPAQWKTDSGLASLDIKYLQSVWSSSSGDAWAVGRSKTMVNVSGHYVEAGAVLHKIDGVWERSYLYKGGPLSDIWGSSSKDIWAVGGYGRIIHFDGEQWTEADNEFNGSPEHHYFAVWGLDSKNVWAGGGSDLLKYDGDSWKRVELPDFGYGYRIHDIWGTSAKSVWIGGSFSAPSPETGNRFLAHFDGSSWTRDTSLKGSYGGDIMAIWGTSDSNIWVTGSNGLLFNYNGSSWKEYSFPYKRGSFYSLWGDGVNNVFAGGYITSPTRSAVIAHFDGRSWKNDFTGPNNSSYVIAITGAGSKIISAVSGTSREIARISIISSLNKRRVEPCAVPKPIGFFNLYKEPVIDVQSSGLYFPQAAPQGGDVWGGDQQIKLSFKVFDDNSAYYVEKKTDNHGWIALKEYKAGELANGKTIELFDKVTSPKQELPSSKNYSYRIKAVTSSCKEAYSNTVSFKPIPYLWELKSFAVSPLEKNSGGAKYLKLSWRIKGPELAKVKPNIAIFRSEGPKSKKVFDSEVQTAQGSVYNGVFYDYDVSEYSVYNYKILVYHPGFSQAQRGVSKNQPKDDKLFKPFINGEGLDSAVFEGKPLRPPSQRYGEIVKVTLKADPQEITFGDSFTIKVDSKYLPKGKVDCYLNTVKGTPILVDDCSRTGIVFEAKEANGEIYYEGLGKESDFKTKKRVTIGLDVGFKGKKVGSGQTDIIVNPLGSKPLPKISQAKGGWVAPSFLKKLFNSSNTSSASAKQKIELKWRQYPLDIGSEVVVSRIDPGVNKVIYRKKVTAENASVSEDSPGIYDDHTYLIQVVRSGEKTAGVKVKVPALKKRTPILRAPSKFDAVVESLVPNGGSYTASVNLSWRFKEKNPAGDVVITRRELKNDVPSGEPQTVSNSTPAQQEGYLKDSVGLGSFRYSLEVKDKKGKTAAFRTADISVVKPLPPSAPSDLAGVWDLNSDPAKLNISWTQPDSEAPISGYQIELLSGGQRKAFLELAASERSAAFSQDPTSSYLVKLTALAENGAFSETVKAAVAPSVYKPLALKKGKAEWKRKSILERLTASSFKLLLSWEAPADRFFKINSFLVYRRLAATGEFSLLGETSKEEYLVSGADQRGGEIYKVVGVSDKGAKTDPLIIKTDPRSDGSLPVPQTVTATPKGAQVKIVWTFDKSYSVYQKITRTDALTGETVLVATLDKGAKEINSYLDKDLPAGSYIYTVAAKEVGGLSRESAGKSTKVVSVAPLPEKPKVSVKQNDKGEIILTIANSKQPDKDRALEEVAVERSLDGVNFETIARSGAAVGKFIDKDPLVLSGEKKTVRYRVVFKSILGEISQGDIISVDVLPILPPAGGTEFRASGSWVDGKDEPQLGFVRSLLAPPPSYLSPPKPGSKAVKVTWDFADQTDVFRLGDRGRKIKLNSKPLELGYLYDGEASKSRDNVYEVKPFSEPEGKLVFVKKLEEKDAGYPLLKPQKNEADLRKAASFTEADILDISGTGKGAVWAVDSKGRIFKKDNGVWAAQDVGQTAVLRSLLPLSENEVWAVGADGAVVKYDGTGWSSVDVGASENLNSITVDNQGEVWIAGDNGTVLHYHNGDWVKENVVAKNNLTSISASANGNIWVVGEAGTILRYNGKLQKWDRADSPTGNTLSKVVAVSPSDIWVVGEAGTILRYNGKEWEKLASPTYADLNDIWAGSADDVWLVGGKGIILHFNGIGLYEAESELGEDRDFNAVWGVEGGLFVGGDKGEFYETVSAKEDKSRKDRQVRDNRRINDLKAIKEALRRFYKKYGTYPVPPSSGSWDGHWRNLQRCLETGVNCGVDTGSYQPLMVKVPQDPNYDARDSYWNAYNPNTYYYKPWGDSAPSDDYRTDWYMLRVKLEDGSNPVLDDDIDDYNWYESSKGGKDYYADSCKDPWYCVLVESQKDTGGEYKPIIPGDSGGEISVDPQKRRIFSNLISLVGAKNKGPQGKYFAALTATSQLNFVRINEQDGSADFTKIAELKNPLNVDTSSWEKTDNIYQDQDGIWHVVYPDGNKVYYVKSKDTLGTKWERPTVLTDQLDNEDKSEEVPKNQGSSRSLWGLDIFARNGKLEVYGRKSADSKSSPFLIREVGATVEKQPSERISVLSGQLVKSRHNESIAATSGGVHTVFTQNSSSDPHAVPKDIVYEELKDDGTVVSENITSTGKGDFGHIFVKSDGELAVVGWDSSTDIGGIFYQEGSYKNWGDREILVDNGNKKAFLGGGGLDASLDSSDNLIVSWLGRDNIIHYVKRLSNGALSEIKDVKTAAGSTVPKIAVNSLAVAVGESVVVYPDSGDPYVISPPLCGKENSADRYEAWVDGERYQSLASPDSSINLLAAGSHKVFVRTYYCDGSYLDSAEKTLNIKAEESPLAQPSSGGALKAPISEPVLQEEVEIAAPQETTTAVQKVGVVLGVATAVAAAVPAAVSAAVSIAVNSAGAASAAAAASSSAAPVVPVAGGLADVVAAPLRLIFFAWLPRRRRRAWGKVRSKETGKGVKGAVVKLLSAEFGRTVAVTRTSTAGEYSFLIGKEGSYLLAVSALGFNSYQSAPFEIKNINKLPTDRDLYLEYDKLAAASYQSRKLFVDAAIVLGKIVAALRIPIMVFGTVLAVYNSIVFGDRLSVGILTAYVAVWVLEYFLRRQPKPYGTVIDLKSGKRLERAIVRLYKVERNGEKLAATAVTDKQGRFSFNVSKGEYRLSALKLNYSLYTSPRLRFSRETHPSLSIKLLPQEISAAG